MLPDGPHIISQQQQQAYKNDNNKLTTATTTTTKTAMTGFMSALRCTIYLCLTLSCFYVCSISVKKFITRPTTTKVTQETLQSGDVPNFAICPHPSVNVSALTKLNGFNMTVFKQIAKCKMEGCDSLVNFGRFVEENKKDSKGVKQLYEDLKFTAFEVVQDVLVQLTNSTIISVREWANTRYMLPLYEMGDCPVFKVPDGLGDTAKVT